MSIVNSCYFTHPFFLMMKMSNMLCLESQRPANKRRKRKGSQSGGAANSAPALPNKKRSPGPNFSLASQVNIGLFQYFILIIAFVKDTREIVDIFKVSYFFVKYKDIYTNYCTSIEHVRHL